MRLLLDTHALVWLLTNDRRACPAARRLVEEEAEEVVVSVVSLWEIAIKSALGRMPLTAEEAEELSVRGGLRILHLRPDHVLALANLPLRPDHRDPFDRMLVAQALHEGLTLMTADAKLAAYGAPTIGLG